MTPSDFADLWRGLDETLLRGFLITLVASFAVLALRAWAQSIESDEDRARRESEAEAADKALDRAIESALKHGGRWV